MIINSNQEKELFLEAANISVDILRQLGESIKPSITPLQLDRLAGVFCKRYRVKPAFRRVKNYRHNTCISVNDVAVHGIPKDIPLVKGDLVSIDFGIYYKKIYTDHCWTWSIGSPNKRNSKLLEVGREAVERCIPLAIEGNYTGDLGFEMENCATSNGFNILKMFTGHGIGKTLHDYPDIPAFGKKGSGTYLKEGMVLCIECQVVDGNGEIITDSDGWSARTKNGGNSVMFEYMVIVGKKSPILLTDTLNWGTVL